MIEFIVEGEPRGKGRPRFTRNGHCFTDKKTLLYERDVENAYKKVTDEDFKDKNIDIFIEAMYKIPKNDSQKKRIEKLIGMIRPNKKPDLDNIIKIILDGLNGVAYKDDAQVINIQATKVYAEEPGVLVRISETRGSLE